MTDKEVTGKDVVLTTVEGGVGWVILNRPEVRNALNRELLEQLQAAVEELDQRPDVSVIIVRGEGPAFCSGYDLTAKSRTVNGGGLPAIDDRRDLAQRISRLGSFRRAAKPTIAAIHGACMGGGLQIAVFCDLVAVSSSAFFGMPRLPVGAGFAAPTLALKIGTARARQLAYVKGTRLTAERALEWGLANYVFDDATFLADVQELGAGIARVPVEVLELEKLALTRFEDAQGWHSTIAHLGDIDALAHTSPAVEALTKRIAQNGLRAVTAEFEAGQPLSSRAT
jgi:enoyl-CoA hydratase